MTGRSPRVRFAVRGLTKFYGSVCALNRVTLTLDFGEKLLLLGANGAGKSTLLSCLAGIQRPEQGQLGLQLEGVDSELTPVKRLPPTILGYVSQSSFLYNDLTLLENLTLAAALHGVAVPQQEMTQKAEQIGLSSRDLRQLARVCSPGVSRRASILRALLHKPKLLLLDEPFTSLDAGGRSACGALIDSHLAEGGSLVIVSHDQQTIESHRGRVVNLERGQTVGKAVADEASRVGSLVK